MQPGIHSALAKMMLSCLFCSGVIVPIFNPPSLMIKFTLLICSLIVRVKVSWKEHGKPVTIHHHTATHFCFLYALYISWTATYNLNSEIFCVYFDIIFMILCICKMDAPQWCVCVPLLRKRFLNKYFYFYLLWSLQRAPPSWNTVHNRHEITLYEGRRGRKPKFST